MDVRNRSCVDTQELHLYTQDCPIFGQSCVYKCNSCVNTQDFRENPVCLCPVKVSILGHEHTGINFDPFFWVCVCVCVWLRNGRSI